jgi:DNA-binding NarL/FixJ family response regulator
MPNEFIRLYLIEDDQTILRFVEQTLLGRPQWRLVGHSDTLAHARLLAPFCLADVFLIDLGLPDGRGEEMPRTLSIARPDAELLVFTVFGDESRLIEALQCGATGYVLKGCSGDELIAAIEQEYRCTIEAEFALELRSLDAIRAHLRGRGERR